MSQDAGQCTQVLRSHGMNLNPALMTEGLRNNVGEELQRVGVVEHRAPLKSPYSRRVTVGKNAALFNRGTPISNIVESDRLTVTRSADPEAFIGSGNNPRGGLFRARRHALRTRVDAVDRALSNNEQVVLALAGKRKVLRSLRQFDHAERRA